jgi:hypothetical protein
VCRNKGLKDCTNVFLPLFAKLAVGRRGCPRRVIPERVDKSDDNVPLDDAVAVETVLADFVV